VTSSLVGVLSDWLTKLIAAWTHQSATDLRISDKATALRRTLAASLEDWPKGPQNMEELVKWAFKLVRGFPVTEPALKEIIDLSAEASWAVRRMVGAARAGYYEAADIINPLVPHVLDPTIKRPWEAQGSAADAKRLAATEGPLRRAFAHVRRSLRALDALGTKKQK
jgi:hypothetical protein